MGGSRGGDGGSGPPGNSQAAIGFLRNVVTDQSLEKQLDPKAQLLLEGGLYSSL